MKRIRTVCTFIFAALLVPAALATSASANSGGAPNASAATGQAHRSCPDTKQAGVASCHAKVITDSKGKPLVTSGPSGYGRPDLVNAYKLPTSGGAGQTIAIVDANDDPNAASDLAVYRSQYGLPPADCVSGHPCFTKLNQAGVAGSYPSANGGWAEEISLDLDVASAICPSCNIMLVEATSASYDNLGQAVNTAANNASVISNSYGGSEFSGETAYDHYYSHQFIPITVSSGDNGYRVEYPAASPNVVAVGGTSLTAASNARGWTEKAWSGAGSGCSAVEPKPAFQTNTYTGCAKRAVADVSAVADPYTGVAVYDTYGSDSGWEVFGGTSVAAPLIAGVYALAGNGASPVVAYNNKGSFFDVTSGNNGRCRRVPSLLCTAGSQWDGPTGLGSPNGIAAF